MARKLSPSYAAAAVVDGIERRAPRVIVPPWWRAWFALRGVLNPVLDRLMMEDEKAREMMRALDSEERSTLRGGLDRTAGRD